MKEITVNIYDYLDREEIKEMINEEFREIIKRDINTTIKDSKSLSNFLSNISYRYVWQIIEDKVDNLLKENAIELITKNVVKVIKAMNRYDVFRSPDYFNRKSVAQEILDKAVEENKEILQKRVKEVLEKEYLNIQAREEMAEIVSNTVYDLLSVKKVEE